MLPPGTADGTYILRHAGSVVTVNYFCFDVGRFLCPMTPILILQPSSSPFV